MGCQPPLALAKVKTYMLFAPAASSTSAQAETVAPVVNTSSTSRIFSPATSLGWTTSNAPATVSRRPFTSIPARYFSGYAYELAPPDFHACFECFIGGAWVVFDATRLAHLNGLVRIGAGRDAADAAVASIFGSARCRRMKVGCQLGEGQKFTSIGRKELKKAGVSLTSAS